MNRGTLKKLAKEGRLEMVAGYHFDDMYGETRTCTRMPVRYSPETETWRDRKDGIVNLREFDFATKSGGCWENPNGTITLYVHSNCNYTFAIMEERHEKA